MTLGISIDLEKTWTADLNCPVFPAPLAFLSHLNLNNSDFLLSHNSLENLDGLKNLILWKTLAAEKTLIAL